MIDSDLYKSVLRAQWDSRCVDASKAVGSHLALGKRNSTPAGLPPSAAPLLPSSIISSCSSSRLCNSTSTASVISPPPACGGVGSGGPIPSSAATSLVTTDIVNAHRRLDRSHSEPVKGDRAAAVAAANAAMAATAANSSRYKTELCRPFEENGFCKYGDKCQFAHGHPELRTLSRHPKYKTDLCRTFHSIGFCPYGPRCHFIHDERRPTAADGSSPVSSNGHLPLGRPHALSVASTFSLGSTADSPSPPASLNGSPTASNGAFFDEEFGNYIANQYAKHSPSSHHLFLDQGLGLTQSAQLSPGGLGVNPELDLICDSALLNLPFDSPPVSPVESLSCGIDKMGLSPNDSNSTSPIPSVSSLSSDGSLSIQSVSAALDACSISSVTSPLNVACQLPSLSSPLNGSCSPLDLSRNLRLPIFERLCEAD